MLTEPEPRRAADLRPDELVRDDDGRKEGRDVCHSPFPKASPPPPGGPTGGRSVALEELEEREELATGEPACHGGPARAGRARGARPHVSQ
ncbi:MAG TPA: hypothetical protein VFH30_07680 [Acidimicrobiales bacterium]|nr:hypothetical protein [Acidimicrobiales bacterium]